MPYNPISGSQFSAQLRRGQYAWPGGYTLRLIMCDGDVMCHDCAKENAAQIRLAAMTKDRSGWRPFGFDVLWEGETHYCCHCNKDLPTEYGEPEDS